MALHWHLGDVVAKLREEMKLKRRELARLAKCSPNTIGELERNANAQHATLVKVAKVLGRSIESIREMVPTDGNTVKTVLKSSPQPTIGDVQVDLSGGGLVRNVTDWAPDGNQDLSRAPLRSVPADGLLDATADLRLAAEHLRTTLQDIADTVKTQDKLGERLSKALAKLDRLLELQSEKGPAHEGSSKGVGHRKKASR